MLFRAISLNPIDGSASKVRANITVYRHVVAEGYSDVLGSEIAR